MKANQNDMNTFLSISHYLTGYDEVDLRGTGMLESYYDVLIHENSIALVAAFLNTSTSILKSDPTSIDQEIKKQLILDTQFSDLTKNIILMWYTGNWNGNVISAQSYIQGLVWKAADTHPPGAKQPGFASWKDAPLTVKTTA